MMITHDYIGTMKRFTRIRLAIALLTLLVAGPRHVTAGEVSSTFDTGYDGWSATTFDTSGEGFGWSWQPEGGNGGGFAQFQADSLSAPFFNFLASPVSFSGDWSALEGIGELRYDVRATGDSTVDAFVVVQGSGGVMWFDRAQAVGDGWLTISAPLVKSEWQVTSGSWEGIMSDVGRVSIYPIPGGWWAIDNVMLVRRKFLRIVREGATSVQITWSTNFADHVLESATSSPAAGWNTVTNAADVVGDHLAVTVGMDASKRFYRLRKP